jgi:hypothetical protein
MAPQPTCSGLTSRLADCAYSGLCARNTQRPAIVHPGRMVVSRGTGGFLQARRTLRVRRQKPRYRWSTRACADTAEIADRSPLRSEPAPGRLSTRKILQKRPIQLSRGASGIKNTFIAVQLKLAQNAVSPVKLWRRKPRVFSGIPFTGVRGRGHWLKQSLGGPTFTGRDAHRSTYSRSQPAPDRDLRGYRRHPQSQRRYAPCHR